MNALFSKLKAQKFKSTGFIFGALFILLITFAAGVQVGLHKARFSHAFGENYERNFGGMKGGPGGEKIMIKRGMFEEGEFRNGHGVAGEILSLSGDSIIIKGRDNQESTVRITDTTIIKRGPDTIEQGDLKVTDKLVVIGKPGEDGVIGAHLVRVLPFDMPQPSN